jgi:hypothetical protein
MSSHVGSFRGGTPNRAGTSRSAPPTNTNAAGIPVSNTHTPSPSESAASVSDSRKRQSKRDEVSKFHSPFVFTFFNILRCMDVLFVCNFILRGWVGWSTKLITVVIVRLSGARSNRILARRSTPLLGHGKPVKWHLEPSLRFVPRKHYK